MFFFCEFSEIVKTVRSSKQPFYWSIWNEYMGLWNAVDWVSIICACGVVSLYFRLYICTDDVNRGLESLIGIDVSTVDRAVHVGMTEDFFKLVENMCSCERDYRLSFAAYPMVVMLRLFKSFHAQPRLGVVTRTLVQSAPDMMHFGIVFSSVYFCMCVNSVLLFGQDIEEFATLDRAVITCFRLMFGQWDYEMMKYVGLVNAGMWFWLFVLIIMVLLLNMLLAILMDAYAEVKSSVINDPNSQTLYDQVNGMMRRRRQFQAKQRVRLNDIWDAYFKMFGDEKEMTSSKEIITYRDIMATVPGIQKPQATRTLANAKKVLDDSSAESYTQDNVKESIDTIDNRSRLIHDEVETLKRHIEQLHDNFAAHDAGAMKPKHDTSEQPRMQVVDAVSDVVGQLSAQISRTLYDEGQLFENRQRELETQQRDMMSFASDTCRSLRQLAARTEEMVSTLDRQANLYQSRLMNEPMPAPSSNSMMTGLGSWNACTNIVPARRGAGI